MKKNQKGFTLIELLVVIAIIGILAALVLVALGNARTKAQDARIKSNVSQFRTLAEVLYDANNASYGAPESMATCITTPAATNCAGGIETSIAALNADMVTIGSGTATTVSAVSTGGDSFCVAATLKADTTKKVCNDSAGTFAESATAACNVSGTNQGKCTP